jgi:hypothetical protein
LAENRLLRGDGRAAHAIALEGLERVRASAPLWGLVSESYVAEARRRAAALGDAWDTEL